MNVTDWSCSIREGGADIMCARGMVNVSRVTVGTYEGGVDSTVGVCRAEQNKTIHSRAEQSRPMHSRVLPSRAEQPPHQEGASINE